ncbi:hypothetical protein LMG28688_06908 [Paraburkholderia caffeinitolerans]|uniref:Uncharacterized protein n=1 Tax=Paraburkholderia caffeinitolerans TaxID=1723730 RepID=A0A6J5H1A0_9BURK|nr:hypothetical protein LMG28688_06908 [Paraburkholderia caffeinitolerans]
MALKHLPPTFCWSRIGSETGEDLPTIVLRKEWERRLGGGRFLWGINQSLGNSAQVAALRTGSLLALFSPAASRARVADVKREDALVWNAWVDASGQLRPLPPHVFVTSRTRFPSGKPRDHHYALVCASPTELSIGSSLRVQPERLRSVSTSKAPCASQGTVVVDRVERAAPRAGAEFGAGGYPVAFGVELEAPYFVRLAQPTRVKARDMAALHEAVRNGDFETWLELTKRLRSAVPAQHARGVTSDLFDLLAKARDLGAVRSISCDTDFDACAEISRGRRSETLALLASGVTHDLFARDLFDIAPAQCTTPVRRGGGPRIRGATFGATAKETSCGAQGDLLRGADWTQLTMELYGDPHPFKRGGSRPTFS